MFNKYFERLGDDFAKLAKGTKKKDLPVDIKDIKERLEKIFDPLFTTKPDGTGLGLSIGAGILKKLGGKISVTSAVGKGSSFTIHLPALPDDDQQEKVQQTNRSLLRMIHGTENSDHR